QLQEKFSKIPPFLDGRSALVAQTVSFRLRWTGVSSAWWHKLLVCQRWWHKLLVCQRWPRPCPH
ncbi:MAG: hypothetical protein ACPGWR_14290, partial [Ardenticatenaceae bacterium]